MKSKILVLMSIYNESLDFIKQSTLSIREQTYSNFCVVIVIDNPKISAEILDYLNSLSNNDQRFLIHRNETNIGLANSLNLAASKVELADFDYIARMDSDDISLPKRFETQINFLLSNPDVDLIGSSAYQIDECNRNLDDFTVSKGLVRLNYGSSSIHPTWMMKKSIFVDLCGYRDFECAQDYDFLCRASLRGYVIENIPEKLIFYRLRSNSIGAKKRLLQRRIKYYISYKYRNKTLLENGVPLLSDNIMCFLFNFIEEVKATNKTLSVLLYPFSLYHMRNIYLLYMNSREQNCEYKN
ncbi:glycosyltransferase [Vibrio diabolicus]|uniref:glycosyltransferase n=1 Tax=Vibrio diabolicus TaxID=50719 RepID=UPI00215EBBDC|nr:glycosyltransferase [Vibrio diabolicus]MCS0305987.1 glycosyltransferase [Vibrio diabolicus]MCS0404658.1 glycosyltransferase [Vibrio diabolicus]